MAYDTLADLTTSIASWLGRPGDTQITDNAGDFVTLAEAYINRALRVRQMETVSTFTTTDGSTNLPDDYLAWKRLTWIGDSYVTVDYQNPNVFNKLMPLVEAGVPSFFTIEGSNIIIRDTDDDTSFELLYFAKVPALVDDTDSNWLLLAYPDLYLAASMVEANAFLMNPDAAGQWAQKRDAIIEQAMSLSERTKGPSRMIPIGGAIY